MIKYALELRPLAVHALETEGANAIPRTFARLLSKMLDLPVAKGIIQINRVVHTGADGYHRLALPALFGGNVKEPEYFLVDDFIGQGGTLANLRGFVESRGAKIREMSEEGLLRPVLIKPGESESETEKESPLNQPAGEIPF